MIIPSVGTKDIRRRGQVRGTGVYLLEDSQRLLIETSKSTSIPSSQMEKHVKFRAGTLGLYSGGGEEC